MDDIVKIVVGDYEKKPDGSWVCVKNSDITTESGRIIRIAPGMAFTQNGKPWGLDVVKALEEASAK